MSGALAQALAAHRAGRLDEADRAYAAHLARAPGDPDALHMWGLLRHQQGRHDEAAGLVRDALAAGAAGPLPHANLAAIELARRQWHPAQLAARAALAIDPAHRGARINLGLAAESGGDAETALAALAGIEDDVRALLARGRAAASLGRLVLAERTLERVLALEPTLHEARLLLATVLLDRGAPERSVAQSETLLAQVPGWAEARSNYLIALQHVPGIGAERLYREHRTWAERHGDIARERRASRGGPPLRLGFVSPRFHAGPVATFLLPLLRAIDRTRFTCFLYAGSRHVDAATSELRALADGWHEAWTLDDDALAARIAGDDIDVLFDLSGHAPANRLRALSRRLAPVQACWLDYFCTTGLDAIDWYLSDPVLTPDASPQHFSERVLRLARGRLCYEPLAASPDVAPREPGPVRFASYNRLAKLNAEVIETWSAILRAVPDATLRLRGSGLDDAETARWLVHERFGAHAIAPGRIELQGFGTHVDTLASYADVDVALDPFPFSGCATTCDALWMGVPVVTLAGETLVSRQSASLLESASLGELATLSRDDYVATAVRLAGDVELRLRLRQELRDRVCAGFADADAFAREFERAVEHMVREGR